MTDNDERSQRFRIGEAVTLVRYMSLESVAEDLRGKSNQLWVFDTNTESLLGGRPEPSVVLEPGERWKKWESVDRILSAAVDARIGRDGLLIGCGGGVVCDLCAFASSIYMRGCRALLMPSTLLAMVDAALGGKTGMDYHGYKNMIGSFYPAEEVRIASGFLATLPEREFRGGLAEVIKHSLLVRSGLRDLLVKRRDEVLAKNPPLLQQIVFDAVAVKGEVVEEDPKEIGRRAILNLGHTFAHALESVSGFSSVSHGEAVGWGIDKALRLGVRLGITSPAYMEEVSHMLESYGFELATPGGLTDEILPAMQQDKKKRRGRVRFVLQREWGDTIVQEVDESEVRAILDESATSRADR
ncbi:MAG TPA: 3-dehydroquinate synthase family protein [Spirochaetia bacterium]|nr:3-dehydroquinate synthase family protein [Spirochaetia bacterium]